MDILHIMPSHTTGYQDDIIANAAQLVKNDISDTIRTLVDIIEELDSKVTDEKERADVLESELSEARENIRRLEREISELS